MTSAMSAAQRATTCLAKCTAAPPSPDDKKERGAAGTGLVPVLSAAVGSTLALRDARSLSSSALENRQQCSYSGGASSLRPPAAHNATLMHTGRTRPRSLSVCDRRQWRPACPCPPRDARRAPCIAAGASKQAKRSRRTCQGEAGHCKASS